MSLLDTLTGGASGESSADEQAALAALQGVSAPTAEALDLPALQQYALAQNMTPAQTQAFLQANNALADEDTDQTGTQAQIAALNQLANTADQGAAGDATEQAQEAQVQQQMGETLAGQRGAIDQQAQARGVAPGLLQAALSQQNAGQDLQNANQTALQNQSNNYQTALQALANEGTAGSNLQGQQNTQANTVAAAQNAMQQFNAANQQNAANTNAANQQQANLTNTNNANAVSQANTGLANQRTQYNAQVPQTVFSDQMQKATGVAGANQNAAQNATNQGQQTAGIYSGLLGAGASALAPTAAGALGPGGAAGIPAASGAGDANLASMAATAFAHGGIAGYCGGGMPMKDGGMIPGHAKVPGDSKMNDTVPIRVSPGEAVIPRSQVQQNPMDVMRLLSGRPASVPQQGEPLPGHHPQDVAALLAAMKNLRGGR